MKAKSFIQNLLRVGSCVMIAISAMSCQTSMPAGSNVSKTVTKSHWVKVSSQPPTYYPRGVSADVPTDQSSGEWVYTDDARGSRYFIPLRGLGNMNRKELVTEALSAQSSRKHMQIAKDDAEICMNNMKNTAIVVPTAAVLSPLVVLYLSSPFLMNYIDDHWIYN